MQTTRRPSPAWLGLIVLLGITMGLSETWAQSFLDGYRWGNFGESRESNRLDREQLISQGNSCPSGGCVLRLDQVEVRPARIARGQTVVLATTYTVLTPEQVAIPVTVSREISFQGKPLGETKDIGSLRLNGTWNQEVDFTVPDNAVPGIYTLKTKVSTGYASDQKEVQFQVE
ncbi:MAG: hypothetical protein ACLQED_02895 [Desulfobaccales bacterium]